MNMASHNNISFKILSEPDRQDLLSLTTIFFDSSKLINN